MRDRLDTTCGRNCELEKPTARTHNGRPHIDSTTAGEVTLLRGGQAIPEHRLNYCRHSGPHSEAETSENERQRLEAVSVTGTKRKGSAAIMIASTMVRCVVERVSSDYGVRAWKGQSTAAALRRVYQTVTDVETGDDNVPKVKFIAAATASKSKVQMTARPETSADMICNAR